MPIKIDKKLPAVDILRSENIFVMDDERAEHQDIRPLNILILNLMPQKIVTETQLLRQIPISQKIISTLCLRWNLAEALFFNNCINYAVYQETPFDWKNAANVAFLFAYL